MVEKPPAGHTAPKRRHRALGSVDPRKLLDDAISEVPVVKYALAVAGVAAAVSLILGVLGNTAVAAVGVPVMIVLMLVMVLLSRAAHLGSALRIPTLVLVWACTVFFVVYLSLVLTAAVIAWPDPLARLLFGGGEPTPTPTPSPPTLQSLVQDIQASQVRYANRAQLPTASRQLLREAICSTANRLFAVRDESLALAWRVHKYQTAGLAHLMCAIMFLEDAALAQADRHSNTLSHARSALGAAGTAEAAIAEIVSGEASPDQHDWVVKNNVEDYLKYIDAVALAIRWELEDDVSAKLVHDTWLSIGVTVRQEHPPAATPVLQRALEASS